MKIIFTRFLIGNFTQLTAFLFRFPQQKGSTLPEWTLQQMENRILLKRSAVTSMLSRHEMEFCAPIRLRVPTWEGAKCRTSSAVREDDRPRFPVGRNDTQSGHKTFGSLLVTVQFHIKSDAVLKGSGVCQGDW